MQSKIGTTSSKRILVISERFYPEEFLINDLVFSLTKKGFKIDVLTQVPSYPFAKVYAGYTNKFFQKETVKGVTVYRVQTVLGYNSSLFRKIFNYINFALLTTLVSIFIGSRYRAVYVFHTGPLTQALPLFPLKLLYQKKIVIWTQDVWPDTVWAYGLSKKGLLKKLLIWFVKGIYSCCDRVHISSPGFFDILKKYVSVPAKIQFVPQWPPQDMQSNDSNGDAPKLEPGKIHFTFAGNIGKVQNLENVILGFNNACKINPLLQLNIIGDGSHLPYLKDVVKTNDIRNVVFWGRKNLSSILHWLQASQFLILSLAKKPILALTIPAKFQAYLLAQRPLYIIAEGEVKELVANLGIGETAVPDDLDSIMNGFLALSQISNKSILEMQQKMKKLLDTDYNKEKIINKIASELIL